MEEVKVHEGRGETGLSVRSQHAKLTAAGLERRALVNDIYVALTDKALLEAYIARNKAKIDTVALQEAFSEYTVAKQTKRAEKVDEAIECLSSINALLDTLRKRLVHLGTRAFGSEGAGEFLAAYVFEGYEVSNVDWPQRAKDLGLAPATFYTIRNWWLKMSRKSISYYTRAEV